MKRKKKKSTESKRKLKNFEARNQKYMLEKIEARNSKKKKKNPWQYTEKNKQTNKQINKQTNKRSFRNEKKKISHSKITHVQGSRITM